MKRNEKSRSRVDNIRYTYEVIELYLILFWEEIQVQRYDPNEFECNYPTF